jgi:hypothetical protein
MGSLIGKIEKSVISIQDKIGKPTFKIGYISDVQDELTKLNTILSNQTDKFPLFWLATDFEENIEKGASTSTTIEMYYIDRSSETLINEKFKNECELMYTKANELFRAMELGGIEIESYTQKLEIYNSKENILNEAVNALKFKIKINYC